MHDKILKALKGVHNGLCVVSTVNTSGQPQSAVMAYAVLEDLSIVLATSKNTRKWKNLKINSNIALSFGWSFNEVNVQYEGTAKLLENGEEFTRLDKIYFEAHPEVMAFRDENTVIIKVSPRWVRISDYSAHPPKVEEM